MVKLGNPKNAIWEAFLITIIIFVVGLLLGLAYEGNKVDEINEYYLKSEISLMDSLALNNLIDLGEADCNTLINSHIAFADKIYSEALILEKLESAGRVSDDFWLAHQKYDTLRTFLWINTIKTLEKCQENFTTVIYLYEYEPIDLAQKATQSVWSRILSDLKGKTGNDIILIPIAVDSGLSSLDVLTTKFEISKYPVVVINNEFVLEELTSVEDIMKYFKN